MRKNKDVESGYEEFRIRFIDVSVKGSSSTLQEAIRSIADSVGQRPIAAPPLRQAIAAPLADNEQPSLDFGEIQEGEISDATPKVSPAIPRSRKRTYAKPDLLDVDLDSGDMPFVKYCETKKPATTVKKYLVIAAWFQKYRDQKIITADHIYTCYCKMNWGIQKDVGQPLRTGKQSDYFKSGPTEGTYELTHIGLDELRKMGGD